jgi:hypothetical protein
MIDELVQQLQSADPEQRRQAIIALGKSRDPTALQHLAQVYRTDPEPGLRDLAQRAGRHLRDAMNAANLTPPPAAPVTPRRSVIHLIGEPEDEPSVAAVTGGYSYDPPPLADELPEGPVRKSSYTPPIQGRDYEVSRENRERAKDYVEEALSMNMRGDNAKAMKMLAQALTFNPNVINESYYMTVAGAITGLEGDGALQMIIDIHQRESFVKTQEQRIKQERIDKHLSEVRKSTWFSSGFEIVLFTLIITIGPVLQVLITVESARAFFNSLPPEVAASAQGQAYSEALSAFNLGILFSTGIISGISGIVGLLIQAVLIHYAATLMLGGYGTLRYMLELLLSYYNKWLPIIFLVSYITIAVAFVSEFSPVVLCFVIPLILLTLYVSGKTSSKIGEAYDFGTLKGCLAYFVSILILLVASVVMLLIIGQAFSTMIQSLIPQL